MNCCGSASSVAQTTPRSMRARDSSGFSSPQRHRSGEASSVLDVIACVQDEAEFCLQHVKEQVMVAQNQVDDVRLVFEEVIRIDSELAKQKSSKSVAALVISIALLVLILFAGYSQGGNLLPNLVAEVNPFLLVISLLSVLLLFSVAQHAQTQKLSLVELERNRLDTLKLRISDLNNGIEQCHASLITSPSQQQPDNEDDVLHPLIKQTLNAWEQQRADSEKAWSDILHAKLPQSPQSSSTPTLHSSAWGKKLFANTPPAEASSSGKDATPPDFQLVAEVHDDLLVFDPESSLVWRQYVTLVLPMERANEMSIEEQRFSQKLRAALGNTWDGLPFDLKLMALRAWRLKSDRFMFTCEQVRYIAQWRKETFGEGDDDAATLLEQRHSFSTAWNTKRAGEDCFGHPIVYDLLDSLDMQFLSTLTPKKILHLRTRQLEALRTYKLELSQHIKQRVLKHIYVLDLKGISLTKHYNEQVQSLIVDLFRVDGTAFPDSTWSIWLVNIPCFFTLLWDDLVTARLRNQEMDLALKAKLHIVANCYDLIDEMAKLGIPQSSLPKELGGEFEGIPLAGDLAKQN